MDSFSFLGDEDPIVVADEKPRGKKMVKGSNVGSVPRKRLADISNMQQPSKLSNEVVKPQQTDSLTANVYVDQLHKENMTLMKLLAERNKLIELNGTELQKMKINLQKAQQQNLQLAKANSSMLAELNSGKDRLRVLQHELGCINTLREARNFVLEDKANTLTCHTSGTQIGADKYDKGGKADEQDKKPCNTNRRRQSKNQILHVGSDSSTVSTVQDKEKVDNKRLRLRRQSGRFKSEEAEPSEERLCLRRQSAKFKCEEPAPEPTQDRQFARFKSVASKPTEDSFEMMMLNLLFPF
ncbi:SHUGOSHIN 2-like isoform X2 [Pistacia vera]|uniref:SHUGOSHIN 2-like isoform X2 n=1 Tax=Pistacia vera TaxID=55513 RepID=UPI0012639562|nr:SHUGOSHIN 2-like isoform X2 [Pistacia vera]